MNAGELLALFRSDVVDDVEPYLWGDAEAYAYMNDAYFMFVRMTGGIPDRTTPVTEICVSAGEATSRLDPSILRIRDAVNVTDSQRSIKIINVQDLDSMTSEDYGLLHSISGEIPSGPIRYMIIGEEEDLARWVNIPIATTDIQLVVERLPLNTIAESDDTFDGVRDEHHYHLLKWVRHLAYRKQDADTFDLVKSDQERSDFFAYCALAKGEKAVRKHKVRVVSYGGI